MKIIVSHDVDHLYYSDHYLRDLIVPKFIVRSSLYALSGKIKFNTLFYRIIRSLSGRRQCRLPEIIDFDKSHNVHSTYFFGMANGLGMSYKPYKAKKWIDLVLENGFDAGVHGIEYSDPIKMKEEYDMFEYLSGLHSFGIRTHYVRYDDSTFVKMADVGYLFDTSQFCKMHVELSKPYKVANMWEFPLHVMDGYSFKPGSLEKAKLDVKKALQDAQDKQLEYFTFLFHDYQYDSRNFPEEKEFYEWFIDYCCEKGYKFINYRDAMHELKQHKDK